MGALVHRRGCPETASLFATIAVNEAQDAVRHAAHELEIVAEDRVDAAESGEQAREMASDGSPSVSDTTVNRLSA